MVEAIGMFTKRIYRNEHCIWNSDGKKWVPVFKLTRAQIDEYNEISEGWIP